MSSPLRFPRRDSPAATQGEREQTAQNRFVSDASSLIAEVGGEVPHPGVLGIWKRDFFGGDAAKTLRALNILAGLGAIRGVGYTVTRLKSGIRDDLFREPTRRPELAVGTLSQCGKYRFNGRDWDLVEQPGESEDK